MAETDPSQPLANARHEAFAQKVAAGRPYGRAYEEAGYRARGNAADTRGSALVRKAQVRARIRWIKEQAADGALVTVEDVIRGLRREADLAENPGSTRVAAYRELGRYLGIFVDRKEISLPKRPEAMADDELEEAASALGLD